MRKHVCILVCSLIFIQCAQDGGADNDTGGRLRPKPGAVPIRAQADFHLMGKWEFENLLITFADDMDENTLIERRNGLIEKRKNSYLEFYEDGKYLFLMNDQSGSAMAGDFNFHKDSLTFHYKDNKGRDTIQIWNVEILNEKRLVLDIVAPETWPEKYVSVTYVKSKTEQP